MIFAMTVSEAKLLLTKYYPEVEMAYDKESRELALRNIELVKRFGMSYAWHAFVTLKEDTAEKMRFECHTSDTTTGVFQQSLPAPEPIRERLAKILTTLSITMPPRATC
jgi:hypothetical protein